MLAYGRQKPAYSHFVARIFRKILVEHLTHFIRKLLYKKTRVALPCSHAVLGCVESSEGGVQQAWTDKQASRTGWSCGEMSNGLGA